MTDITVKPLVLARLNAATPIINPASGQPLPGFVQTLNNAWANISTAFTALAQREADQEATLARIVALNGLLTATQDQVTAILADRQSGVIAATVRIGGSATGTA